MTQNTSLSVQEVADILRVSKSTVYDLIHKGEIHSFKIGRKLRFTRDDVDAYIARSRHEHSVRSVQKIDTHSSLLTPPEAGAPELIISGQDVVLDILANHLLRAGVRAARTHLSGFEGLLALYQDRIHVAASHLYDGEEYNVSYVRSLMPGIPAVLVNVTYRTLGFYVRKGNPKRILGWEDLGRSDLSIVNRRPGSSARIVLDTQLKRLKIPASSVKGYETILNSHLTVAAAVAEGEADVAIGTERISQQIDGIDFIPLLEERFDFVIKKALLEDPAVRKMLQIMNSPIFLEDISHFSGNDYRDIGKLITEV